MIRQWLALRVPYSVWRVLAVGMKAHMRQVQPVRNLVEMVNYPDELLDRKGLYVKQIARELLWEYQNEGI